MSQNVDGPFTIVYFNPAANLGGGELSLLDLISSTRQALDNPHMHLIVTAPGPLADRAGALGVRVHVLRPPGCLVVLGDSALRGRGRWRAVSSAGRGAPAALLATWGYARRLRGLIRALSPDVVHSNGIKAHLLLRLASPPGVPVVWHIRDFLGSRPLVAGLLRRAAHRKVVGAVAVSEAVARDARGVLGGAIPVEAHYDGIDVEVFAPSTGDGAGLDAMAGLPPAEPGTVRVGLIATYALWKGHRVFLDALSQINPTDLPPVRGYVIGGPIYETKGSQFSREGLEARAAELGLDGRIGFVPFQPHPAPVYRALDILVHASTLPEPFGRTIVEAMACGRPAIVARAGGAAELFEDGRDAVGTRPGDAASLAAAIRRLADDPDLRRGLSERARRSAVDRFDRGGLGPAILEVYRRFGIAVPAREP